VSPGQDAHDVDSGSRLRRGARTYRCQVDRARQLPRLRSDL